MLTCDNDWSGMPHCRSITMLIAKIMCALSALSLFSLVCLASSYDHEIYIDPNSTNSVNNETCFTNSTYYPCHDINFALTFRQNSTIFYLSSNAMHKLTNNVTNNLFIEKTEIAFVGDNGSAVIVCDPDAGLAFIDSNGISFIKVEFLYCGAWRNSTSVNFTTNELLLFRVGLYFYNCRDVNMTDMSVSNSSDALGVVMYSVAGNNYIGYSNFNYNTISNSSDSGGGGFAVEFNYCKPGDSNCTSDNHQVENNENAVYHFEHCNFKFNRAIDQSGHNQAGVSIIPFNKTHFSLGRGGGLLVYFKGESLNNSIFIDNCNFEKNHANWGGGLCVQYADRSIQNTVSVSSSNFITNHCYFSNRESSGRTGGGVLVTTPVRYEYKRENFTRNEIVIVNCNFTDNRAITGGALAFVYTLQRKSHRNQIFRANVSDSIFSENEARLGSAISIDHEYFYHEGVLGDMFISDSKFLKNTIVYTDTTKAYSLGIGTVYISEVPVNFQNDIQFCNSTGSALALVGTLVTFEDNSAVNFMSNYGANGGAIALLGVSSLLIRENVSMFFTNNRARQFGGAIYNSYTGKEDLRSSVKCFLRYYRPFTDPKSWNAKFVFRNNSANKLGNSIYSTTILPCSGSDDPDTPIEIARKIFCWNESVWVYEESNCSAEIYTSPQNFSYLEVTDPVYPGHSFKLNITARDDLNHDVTIETIYTASIKDLVETAEIDPQYAYVANGSLAITGEENQNVTLQLDVAGNRDWRMEVKLPIQKCPLGFKAQHAAYNVSNDTTLDNLKQTKCICLGNEILDTFGGNLICDKSSMSSKIRNGYWAGYVSEASNTTLYLGTTRLLVKNVPDNYLTINDSETQCSDTHREGALCGKCVANYSSAVNSYNYECVECTKETTIVKNILTYIAITYLPYLVLFVLILCFNLNLMSGPLIGFVLYAQLVGSGVIELTIDRLPSTNSSSAILSFQKSYRVAYGVFNLNSLSMILDPFCIHENFSALDVISLDYAVAVFPLILIIAIRLIVGLKDRCNFRRRVSNYTSIEISSTSEPTFGTGKNVGQKLRNLFSPNFVHAFVGFIYLSYTKMSLAATLTLTTTNLMDINGSYIIYPRLIYYAGHYIFGEFAYILPYGLLAVLVYTACIILPFTLLGGLDFINWVLGLSKCARLRGLWPSSTINPFLEAMQDCYRPKRRYFAGFYFLFRLILLTIYAFSANVLTQVLSQLSVIFAMIIIIAIMLPYKKIIYNIIDILLLTNMAVIALISIYLHSAPSYTITSTYPIELYIFGGILIWLPMVYLLLYLSILILQKTRCYRGFVENLRYNRIVMFILLHFSNSDVYTFQEKRPNRLLPVSTNRRLNGNDIDDRTDSLMQLIESEQENPFVSTAGPVKRNSHLKNSKKKSKVTQSIVFEVSNASGTADIGYGGTSNSHIL